MKFLPLLAAAVFTAPLLGAQTPGTTPGFGAATSDKTQQLLQEGANRTGQAEDAWKKVLKSYPTTTHQRTIEYRLPTKDAVQKIFDSAESAFRLQRNTVFKGE